MDEPYVCPTPCREGCQMDCHEWHKYLFERSHDAFKCMYRVRQERTT